MTDYQETLIYCIKCTSFKCEFDNECSECLYEKLCKDMKKLITKYPKIFN